jgi:hypothetical protein
MKKQIEANLTFQQWWEKFYNKKFPIYLRTEDKRIDLILYENYINANSSDNQNQRAAARTN